MEKKASISMGEGLKLVQRRGEGLDEMKPLFYVDGNWILPREGTLGNKAANLLANTPVIEASGFRVPRSLVVPFEYLQLFGDKWPEFMLNQLDTYFPGWKRLMVRSNSPDEDLGKRTPGMYVSEDIWHKDRKYANVLIGRVVESYDSRAAKSHRFEQELPEKGMCLLVQEPVTNDSPLMDKHSYAACFTDLGELGILTFTNHKKGLEAMVEPPLRQYRVNTDGKIEEKHSESEGRLAIKLRQLTQRLPQVEGKGWGIELVGSDKGDYVIQTSPIHKHEGDVEIEQGEQEKSMFHTIGDGVVGTGKIRSEGILYLPPAGFTFENIAKILRFNETHKNYCAAIPFELVHSGSSTDALSFVSTASVLTILCSGLIFNRPFAPHVTQHMREGRIALAGFFADERLSNILRYDSFCKGREVLYSSTNLRIRANEYTRKALVTADGKVEPFVNIE